MKVFLAILAVVSCVLAKELTPKTGKQLEELHNECLKQHPASSIDEQARQQFILCEAKGRAFYNAYNMAIQNNVKKTDADIKNMANNCVAKYYSFVKSADVVVLDLHNCLEQGVTGKKA